MNQFKSYVVVALGLAVTVAHAQEKSPQEGLQTSSQVKVLDAVVATVNLDVSKERKSRTELNDEMVGDIRDLVRYSTDVGIVDNGRHIKGFAMRGVEGNRVGISIDGVSLPEFEENSLYARYGNFNNSRMVIDPELTNQIEIVKGGSSFESGSGFLGGGVNYRTLSAPDFVREGQSYGALLRSGYSSKNREWYHTLGLGYIGAKLEATLLYSRRRGHEMKSNGDVTLPKDKLYDAYHGSTRQIPDPVAQYTNNYLLKLNYRLRPEHNIGLSLTGHNSSRFTNEFSYSLFRGQWRDADDTSERTNLNTYYEWTPDSAVLSSARLDLDYQQTKLSAINDKGSRNWTTNLPELDERYERIMQTKYKRVALNLKSQAFSLLGAEHRLTLLSHYSEREFENLNKDLIGIGRPWGELRISTIQYPMKTKQFSLALSDNIDWNDKFSSYIGIRYDEERVKAESLNAPCSKACIAEGKPAGNTFRNWSGILGLNYQVNDTWSVKYQLSSAYRVPTASEMYFTFTNPYGTWQSNPNLKAERSLSQVISLQAANEVGMMDLSIYQTRYKDFLHEQESIIKTANQYWPGCAWYGCSEFDMTPKQQMVNLDNARIRGIEFKGSVNLDKVISAPQGLRLSGSIGYSKGKLSNDTSLLSIQPLKVVLGLDYEDPAERWGIFSRFSYYGGKKARDAKVTEIVGSRSNLQQKITNYKYLNSPTFLLDVFGYYRPMKNMTIRAGVYNITNRKYQTWDALRGINAHSTTNSVDQAGHGLQRYYAPGRNFALAFEYKY